MSHFALVVNNMVQEVIVADQEFVNGLAVEPGSQWIQTSYNTHGGVHYDQNGLPDGGTALRGNFAGVGYTYSAELDAFIPPSPYAQWILNTTTFQWQAPVPQPETELAEGEGWIWNEYIPGWEIRSYYL